MKIGILTASRTDNNGTDLQALAMQNLFQRMGAKEVEIINYICKDIDCDAPKSLTLRNIIYFPIWFYAKYTHKSFRKRYFRKSQLLYTDANIDKLQYDVIVVGSDQIWNLSLTGGDMSFYLPFSTDSLKYSYAASLGSAQIEKWEPKYKIKEKLSDFKDISVRENSSLEALRKIGINARYDLDPILMGNADDWNSFIVPAKRRNYILLYMVSYDKNAIEYAQMVGKQYGCEILMLNGGFKYYKNIKILNYVSIQDWLNLMANARMVITNSYHGLSFAILFKRDFRLCLLPNIKQNNNRMIDLLKMLELEDYTLEKGKISYKPINWNKVDVNLNSCIIKSEKYIESIINNSI